MRMLSNKNLFYLLLLSFFFAVNVTAQTEGVIKVESNERIKQLIAKKRAYNKNLTYVKGYKIQLFYGSEKGATSVKDKFNEVFPRVKSELRFDSPDWKVWVGSYKERLEADRALAEIKEGFPSAIILATKVKI